MSIDDLKRNREIFGILTGVYPNAPEPATPLRQNQAISTNLEAGYGPRWGDRSGSFATITDVFSLERGKTSLLVPSSSDDISYRRLSAGKIEYPESAALSSGGSEVYSDPVENLFRRLETEARLSSQLLSEEDY